MKYFVATLFLLTSIFSYSNDFYVGDKIKLRIENVPESDIRETFKNFDIEKLEQDKDGIYLLEMRNYEVGNYRINIGGQEIIFNILTNLNGQEKDIFMDLTDMSNRKLFLPRFPYWTIVSLLFFGLGLFFALKKIIVKVTITPEEKYKEGMSNLDEKTWNFQVSYLVREYIDNIYGTNFLNGIYEKTNEITSKEINFIKELDYAKFSGKTRPEDLALDEKNPNIKTANEIFDRIYSAIKEKREEEEQQIKAQNSTLSGRLKNMQSKIQKNIIKFKNIIRSKDFKNIGNFGGEKDV
ncbi:MAG: hypothetical protein ACRCSK_08610 [Fusobacteriaceae bacterium]